MSDERYQLAIIAGGAARAAGRRASHNPHPAGSSLARCWIYGFRRDEQVSRETAGVGRGHSALGPRAEWTEAELDDLEQLAADEVPDKIIALLMERSYSAVRGQLHRLRQRKAA